MLAVSPATLAIAQTANSTQLDPLVVEAEKKKKATAAKKSAPKQAVAPAPQPVAQPQPPEPPPPISDATPAGATFPGGNPYANPDAPYMVEQSANPKLTQPLADTPRTITAVPEAVMEDQGVRDLRELARNVPGLTIGSAEGGNAYGAFAIRGFKANNDIFVDSIRNPGNVIPDVFAVQQIEIYKGPSGGIAGRSTIGGAINLISKQPDLNFNYYELDTTVGTDSTFRTTVDANQVITHDFAVRANLMYDQHDVAGRDITDSERWGGLFSARARPTDDVMVTLDYYRYRNDAIPDWGVPVLTRTNGAPANIPPNAIHQPITEFGFSRDMFVGMKDLDFFEEQADIGTATIVAKLADNITLTNTSRAGQSRVNYVATSMEGIPDVHHPNRDQMAQIYANQTELNVKFTTGTFKHDLVAGLEVTRENLDRDAYLVSSCFDNTPGTALTCPSAPGVLQPRSFPPNPFTPTDTILAKANVYDATIDDVGVYLLDTIHLSKEWIINGGIRFDDFTRDQVGGPGVPSATVSPAINAQSIPRKVQEDLFSWNAGIVYKPVPIGSIYAAYGTSESPIGSELDATGAQYNGLSSILVNAPPQEARAIEVGTKWELFDRRLLATAALFQTDVDNARTNAAPTNPTTGTPNPPINPYYFIRANIAFAVSSWGQPAISPRSGACSAARAPRHRSSEVRPSQPARCRTTTCQHSADAVLADVQVPADRPTGARRHGDLRRRSLRRPSGRQRQQQSYGRLVAVRCLCRVRADQEYRARANRPQPDGRAVLRCDLSGTGPYGHRQRHVCLRGARPRRLLNRQMEIRLRTRLTNSRSAKPTGAPCP